MESKSPIQRKFHQFNRGECGICKKKIRVDRFCDLCGVAWCNDCSLKECKHGALSFEDLWANVYTRVKEVAEEGWSDYDEDDVRTAQHPTATTIDSANQAIGWCKEQASTQDVFSLPVISIDPMDCGIRLIWGEVDTAHLEYQCRGDTRVIHTFDHFGWFGKAEEAKKALLEQIVKECPQNR